MLSRRFHIVIDAFDCPADKLTDKNFITTTIKNIASLVDMTILHGPIVVDGDPANPGVTGFAIIDYSHISIHTFTESNEFCLDIFSCKKFDYQNIYKYIKKVFAITGTNIRTATVKYDNSLKQR